MTWIAIQKSLQLQGEKDWLELNISTNITNEIAYITLLQM